MPKFWSSRTVQYKDIPTRNPYRYRESMSPLFKTQKFNKEGMTKLLCRATHFVKTHSVCSKENDNLYEIFAEVAGQLVSIMHEWLKFFVLLHRKSFEHRAHSYLKSNGLSLNNWSNSITDSRKGDVLVLYCLNLLTETHIVLHLKDGGIWMALYNIHGPWYWHCKPKAQCKCRCTIRSATGGKRAETGCKIITITAGLSVSSSNY